MIKVGDRVEATFPNGNKALVTVMSINKTDFGPEYTCKKRIRSAVSFVLKARNIKVLD